MLSDLIGLFAPIAAAVAGTGASPVALEVDGEGCLAGLTVVVALREPATARATLRGGALILETRSRGELGERTIVVDDAPCEEIRAAASLAVALSLEEMGVVEPAPPVAPAPVIAAPRPAPSEPPSRVAERERPLLLGPSHPAGPASSAAAPSRHGGAELGAAVDVGLAVGATSNAAMSASVLADLIWSPVRPVGPELSARLGLFAALPSRMTLDTGEDDESVLSLWSGRFDACAGLSADAFRARLCATFIAGALDGTALEATGYFGAGGRGEVGWRATPRVTLTVSADTFAKLAPTTLTVERDFGETALATERNPLAVVFATGVTTDFL